MKKKRTLSLFVMLMLLCGIYILPAQGIILAYDDFNDGILDSAWTIDLKLATGWSYTESGTNLNVTDIIPTVMHPQAGQVILTQTFTPITDFNVDFNISWDSESSNQAMQFLCLSLWDEGYTDRVRAGYFDPWVGSRGKQGSSIGGGVSFHNELSLDGLASINISRVGNEVNILWDGVNIASGTNNTLFDRVEINFGYWKYAGSGGTSFFGNESVDLVTVEGNPISPIPEPSTCILFLFGLVGMVGIKKKLVVQ